MNPADELAPQLAHFRPDLLRFARLQLRDDPLAEDVVQETMIAALAGRRDFAGHWQRDHRPGDWGDPEEMLRQA